MKNPLEILECTSKSTPDEITKKFRKLAMKYHPDRNSTLDNKTKKEYENQFKEINCAFTYLKKIILNMILPMLISKTIRIFLRLKYLKMELILGIYFKIFAI